jgi:hypothetical protein
MKSLNIVYLTTYIDEELENSLGLPFFPAGLSKKQQLISILSDHTVSVVFVSMFTRMRLRGGNNLDRRLSPHANLVVPYFFMLPVLNYIINPIITYKTLVKLWREQEVDCIILYNCVFENSVPVYFFNKIYKTKVVCQYEDGWVVSGKWTKLWLYKLSHNLINKISSGVIANSRNFLEIVNNKKYFIFRGSLKFSQLNKIKSTNFKNKTNVLFASSIDEIRGVQLLMNFFNQIHDEYIIKNFSFMITGRGDKSIMKSLKESVYKFNSNGGDAIYCGYVSRKDLQKLYQEADILLALQDPSLKFSRYCFPSKIFEYYQYNHPIVTTNISDLDSNDFFNLNFIDYSIESLSSKLIEIRDNFNHYVKSNDQNNTRLNKLFSVEKNRQGINDFLKDLYE